MITDAQIIGQLGAFSDQEVALFSRYSHTRVFKKGELLLRPGSFRASIYFLKQGSVVQYKKPDERERQYENLYVENSWLFDNGIFSSQNHAASYLEAFSDCDVVEVSLSSIHHLISLSPSFLALNKIFNSLADRVNFLNAGYTPAQKYDLLVKSRPEVIRIFPLKVIASYLKISPETLSRVRAMA